MFAAQRSRRALPGFDRPTQIVWGRQDPFLTMLALDKLRRALPHAACHVIDRASHFLQEDAPDKVSEAILDFVPRVKG